MSNVFSIEEFERLRNCFKIIPTAYDDSLSYYDQMSAVLAKIIQAIDKLSQIEDLSHAYTDEQISILKADMLILINNLSNELKSLSEKEQSDVNNLQLQINNVIVKLSETIQTIDKLIDSKISQYDTYVKNYISSQLIDVRVINYFTGDEVTIQYMLDYLAQLHITTGLTYAALIARTYTYTQMIDICSAGNYSYADIIRDAETIFPQK